MERESRPSSSYLEFVKGDKEPLSPTSFKIKLALQAKLLFANEQEVSKKLATLLNVSFGNKKLNTPV